MRRNGDCNASETAEEYAILLTLINEYTDWTRPVEHPINLLDSLLDIMSDALVVAPVIETGDLHSRPLMPTKPYHRLSSSARPQTRGKTFFYVFVHQSEEGSKFHQRLGCAHGEELAYMFGAPLSQHLLGKSMAQFAQNYSRTETQHRAGTEHRHYTIRPQKTVIESSDNNQNYLNHILLNLKEVLCASGVDTAQGRYRAQALHYTATKNRAQYNHPFPTRCLSPRFPSRLQTLILILFSFALLCPQILIDPNLWPTELDTNGDRTKGRFESVLWPQYEPTQRKYLMLENCQNN
ncbi:unnamed protein product [Oppiella nova]|uniref:Carboxylesterase type B domain-containing protein n=1 Tax=Oppiella nova TaxID=334625 RepID=A0A7R9LH71_9ACAR|nr:unnamed protein product [Oppiella nova]CAG2163518.1 unnamed protein product [Oppiella nova]